ncbi:MAG TPA: ATP-binding protein [Syntrophales bacterium]|nr:ATP-binding protein [Syntrophales bacterium]
MTSLEIARPAVLENLEFFIQGLSRWLADGGMRPDCIKRVQLAVEEALVNVFRYAYGKGSGMVSLRGRKTEDGLFLIEIIDQGVPFDICTAPAPDLSCTITDRKIGGLGVFFIKKMTDEIRYRREGDSNVLTLVVRDKDPGVTPFKDKMAQAR